MFIIGSYCEDIFPYAKFRLSLIIITPLKCCNIKIFPATETIRARDFSDVDAASIWYVFIIMCIAACLVLFFFGSAVAEDP
jgi:hypothetical protein